MILDARSGLRGVLVDEENGRRIPFARWANLATGEYEAFRADPSGRSILRDELGKPILVRGRCRLRFIPDPAAKRSESVAYTMPCVESGMGLRRLAYATKRRCQHPGCVRPAEWVVADEAESPPVAGPDGLLYRTAKLVGVRYFCSWHYEWPRLKRADGNVVDVEVTARPG